MTTTETLSSFAIVNRQLLGQSGPRIFLLQERRRNGADPRDPMAKRSRLMADMSAGTIADDGSTLYVGIEGVNQIVRFDYGKDGLLARLTL